MATMTTMATVMAMVMATMTVRALVMAKAM
jgi:hypothetical protein